VTEIASHPGIWNALKNAGDGWEARKPVIIAGSGVWHAHAEEALVEFAEKAGVPVFTSLSGRGTISDEHPLCFEVGPGHPTRWRFCRLHRNRSGDFAGNPHRSLLYLRRCFQPGGRMVQVDIMPEEIGRNRSIDLPIVSDAGAFLRECCRIMDAGDGGVGLQSSSRNGSTTLNAADETGKAQAVPTGKATPNPSTPCGWPGRSMRS
jgi:acetolactate synthase-1/2/3 large subunit